MTSEIVFLGSNHNLQQMVDLCQLNGLAVRGIVDSDYYKNTSAICNVPVIGSELDYAFGTDVVYFNAVNWAPGSSNARNVAKHQLMCNLINQLNLTTTNLIHPSAIVPKTAIVGTNVLIGAYAILGNYVTVGDFAQIREQSYVAHNTNIQERVILQVQGYVGSNITVGADSYLAVKSAVVSTVDRGIVPPNTFVRTLERYVVNQ